MMISAARRPLPLLCEYAFPFMISRRPVYECTVPTGTGSGRKLRGCYGKTFTGFCLSSILYININTL